MSNWFSTDIKSQKYSVPSSEEKPIIQYKTSSGIGVPHMEHKAKKHLYDQFVKKK